MSESSNFDDNSDEVFDEKQSQKKRAENRKQSAKLLLDLGIIFTSNNGGAHLAVKGRNYIIDFWPGTGKYIGRGGCCEGRGVKNLLKYCDPMGIRESVMWFALEMEKKLRANDNKGGWATVHQGLLFSKLRIETGELYDAISDDYDGDVIKEAADVANYAMMIADNARES